VCSKCGHRYQRDFRTRTATHSFEHKTGRTCARSFCKGELVDTIINFGEDLAPDVLQLAFDNGEKADLCLSLGTSLTVAPSCLIPEAVGKQGSLVIVNLQRTPLDHLAAVRVFARCDTFMELVMEHLELPVPPFVLTRRIMVRSMWRHDQWMMETAGLAPDCRIPASTLGAVDYSFPHASVDYRLETEPFILCSWLHPSLPRCASPDGTTVDIHAHFFGNFGEPSVSLTHTLRPGMAQCQVFEIRIAPMSDATWTVRQQTEQELEEDVRREELVRSEYSRPIRSES